MEFWENVKEKVGHVTHKVAKKSTELVEVTKLKMSVSETEASIDKIFKKMGEALYEAYKTGAESYGSLEESCEEIDAAYARIEELRERINELKETKLCPNCKKEMELDAAFCSGCGEHLE